MDHPILESTEKEKPAQCRNPKGWSWKIGDVGYIYHSLFNCWIKLIVINTSGHNNIIFEDDSGITYIQKAWTKNVFPISGVEENERNH